MAEDNNTYEFVVISGNSTVIGTLQGNRVQVLLEDSILAHRCSREEYIKRMALYAYLHSNQGVAGVIVAGSGDFPHDFAESRVLDPWKAGGKVLRITNLEYDGLIGLRHIVEQSADLLPGVKLYRDDRVISSFFQLMSQDTGKIVWGAEATLKALGSSSLKTLIVWEDLNRVVMVNNVTGEMEVKYLTGEEEANGRPFKAANGATLLFQSRIRLLEWIQLEYNGHGVSTVSVTDYSQLGRQFCKGFKGVGGILLSQLVADEDNGE